MEDPARVVAEAARVVRPGGLFFFHTFNRNPLAWLVVIKGVEWFVKNTPKDMHVLRLFIKPAELARMCVANGLRVVELHGSAPVVGSLAFWKARPVLSLFVVAFGQGAIGFMGGWLCGSSPPRPWLGSPSAMLGTAVATLVTVAFLPLSQIYQTDEDSSRGDRTFAVAFRILHRLQFGLSFGMLGYMGVRLILG